MPPISGAAPVPRSPLPWTFALAYVHGWDDNPLFAAPPIGGGWNGRVFSSLTHRRHGTRSDIVLDGRAEGWVVRDSTRPDRLTYAASGSGAFVLSPRLNARLDEAWQTAYTDESTALAREVVLLRTVIARTNFAAGQLSYHASTRTSLTADLRHELVRFSPALDLVGYSRMALTLGATRRRGLREAYSVSAALQERWAAGRSGRGIAGGVGLERGLGPRLFTRLSVGIQAFDTLVTGQHRVEPYGAASLDGHFHDTLLSLDYSHFLTPGFEDGRDRMVDAAGLTASRRLAQKLILFAGIGGGRRRDLEREGFRTWAFRTEAGLAAQVSRRLEARLTHTYEHSNEREPLIDRSRQRFDVSLGYRREW